MKDKEKQTKVFDILDKMEFFQGQRAGRELWNDKPKEVQDKDIADFIKDINYIRSYLQDSVVLSREEYDTLHTNLCEYRRENKELCSVISIANEREYRKKFTDEWRKEYQKELDKQGNGHIAGHPDFDLVYKLYFEQKDRIAELEEDKEKWQRKAVNYYQMAKSYGIECIVDNYIDETLKEYEK